MKMLIIGNGFDLAHNLPTSYKDFIKFISEDNLDDRIQMSGKSQEKSLAIADEIRGLIKENFWINYFQHHSGFGENWIDFESEISKVVQELDLVRPNIERVLTDVNDRSGYRSMTIREFFNGNFEWFRYLSKGSVSFKALNPIQEMKNILLCDLKRMSHCLEIYLSEIVNVIPAEAKLNMFEEIEIDHVLSFNYTNTYERIYGNKNTEYHYIHGYASENGSIDNCNLILGIDEYLTDGKQDSDNEFIEFKKFFQRIYHGTGAVYKKWIHESDIRTWGNTPVDDIFIVGHSMDVTDRDVLKEILLLDSSTVHIVYHSKKAMADKISNMVKIIGEEKLIELTYAENPRIVFEEQY